MEIHPFPALFLFAQSYLTDAVNVIFSDYCFTDTYLIRAVFFICNTAKTNSFAFGQIALALASRYFSASPFHRPL